MPRARSVAGRVQIVKDPHTPARIPVFLEPHVLPLCFEFSRENVSAILDGRQRTAQNPFIPPLFATCPYTWLIANEDSVFDEAMDNLKVAGQRLSTSCARRA